MQFNLSLKDEVVEEIRELKGKTEKETAYIRRAVMEKLERDRKEKELEKKRLEEMEKEWRNYIRGE